MDKEQSMALIVPGERSRMMSATPVSTVLLEANGLIQAFADADADEVAFRAHLIAGHATVNGALSVAKAAMLVRLSADRAGNEADQVLPAAIAGLMDELHKLGASVG
jgi:hypothetical protein